ncbi:glycoside hydrolase family 5 protein [Candidatus Bathyarchaeota archaeon A05DMB-2]|nr:glycoside hydrolase family 5 protein [Candidatus Bathyarchaeota archaeon A05DMB-2]
MDGNGNRIILRGVGFDYAGYNRPSDLNAFFIQAKSRGYNCIRLAFGISPWYEHHIFYDSDLMDQALALCEEYQMYAILDCMDWWAQPSVQGWEAPLPLHEDVWLQTWLAISNRYKNNPIIAGYELYNEILGEGSTPDGKGQYDVYIDCINMLRANGDNHILIVYDSFENAWKTRESEAGVPNRLIFSPANKPSGGNIMYATHRWWGGDQANPGDYAQAQREAAEYVNGLITYSEYMGNVPVWAGEFGTYDYDQTYTHAGWEYIKEVIRLCDEAGISWNYWSPDTFGAPGCSFVGLAPDAPEHITPTPYTTSILSSDIPKPFNPKPFNLLNHVVDNSWPVFEVDQNRWGVTWLTLPNSAYWATLSGPIQVRVKTWAGNDPYGQLLSDVNVTISAGQTRKFTVTSYTEIYAQAVTG